MAGLVIRVVPSDGEKSRAKAMAAGPKVVKRLADLFFILSSAADPIPKSSIGRRDFFIGVISFMLLLTSSAVGSVLVFLKDAVGVG